MFLVEQKVSRGKLRFFCIRYFWRTKHKSTKTTAERCVSCQNKPVCEKLPRSCKKKPTKNRYTPLLHEGIQVISFPKLNRGIPTLSTLYLTSYTYYIISSPLSATPRTKQDPQGIKFEAYTETKGIFIWHLTLKMTTKNSNKLQAQMHVN